MTEKNNILIKDYSLFDKGFLLGCDAVAETYGAEGGLAVLDNGNEPFLISKDGATVMKHIRHSNKTVNFGILQALAGCIRTMSLSGDSTTTTAIFMQGYLRKLDRSLFNKSVEKGILCGVEDVYKLLDKLSITANKQDIEKIAKVACNNDDELAKLVLEAFDYVGDNGVVEYVVKPNKEKTEVVQQEGLVINNGYTSPYFINREDKKLCYEAENVAVLCSATWEYSPFIINHIKAFYEGKKRSEPLLIVLERPNSDMLEKLIGIKQVGYNICLINSNMYSEFESETLLNDIANFTGAVSYNPRDTDNEVVFGIADKVVSTVEGTSIIVEEVPQTYKDTLAKLESSEIRDEGRIKRLKTKAAIIEIGAKTPSAQIEVMHRVEDCISSIKTTKDGGFIPGGGSTLVYISGLMKKTLSNSDEQLGYDLVREVIKEPLLRLLKNANRQDKSLVKTKWYEKNKTIDYITPPINRLGYSYNASSDKISNLLEDGIIDSKKSIKIALESATERAIQTLNIKLIVHYPTEQTL